MTNKIKSPRGIIRKTRTKMRKTALKKVQEKISRRRRKGGKLGATLISAIWQNGKRRIDSKMGKGCSLSPADTNN
jgi:hypothetical protein